MTHKQECIYYCIDYLNQRSIYNAYDSKTFNHYYRKNQGAWGNAYLVGMAAADMMIENFKTTNTQEVSMTEEMKLKRQALKALSKEVMQFIEQEQAATVNEALVIHYAQQGHTNLHSFRGWLTEGKVVKKGEKALLLWGEPRQGGKIEKEKPQPGSQDDDDYKFFPLAYVFSEKQVEPLTQKKAA